ncbi:hypothetical protein BS17DRAFT_358435 [Gyrodon lividus]|nr:hypothetical protein BS17DRAFT_358435 [Gyrodon lividus]
MGSSRACELLIYRQLSICVRWCAFPRAGVLLLASTCVIGDGKYLSCEHWSHPRSGGDRSGLWVTGDAKNLAMKTRMVDDRLGVRI